jgi:hypothetical protein
MSRQEKKRGANNFTFRPPWTGSSCHNSSSAKIYEAVVIRSIYPMVNFKGVAEQGRISSSIWENDHVLAYIHLWAAEFER